MHYYTSEFDMIILLLGNLQYQSKNLKHIWQCTYKGDGGTFDLSDKFILFQRTWKCFKKKREKFS